MIKKQDFTENIKNNKFNYTRKSTLQLALVFSIILILSGYTIRAQDESEWPCFHGPDRSNKSTETGLLDQWPEAGPQQVWTVSGLGDGYSSVSIARGCIYTAGMADKTTYVFAFDLDGKLLWKKPNGQSWEATMSHATGYTGTRSTPTYDNGIVYHLGETGQLTAFEYNTGQEVWSKNLREQFDAEIPEYGYSESVFIDGEKLYCCPAGKKGYMVCLEKLNGNLIWVNTEIPGNVGFNSPVLFEHGGYRQIAGVSSNCVYGVDSETGKMLWHVNFKNDRDNNITDPIFSNGYLFASTGYGKGSILIKLTPSGEDILPEISWQIDLMDNHHGGVILHEGYLYGAGHNARGWFCLDFMTGSQMWKVNGKGSLTYADGMLYCLEERGIMTLVIATSEKYNAVSSFEVPGGGKGMHWAHPVVSGGRLYIRHADKLFVYNVKEE